MMRIISIIVLYLFTVMASAAPLHKIVVFGDSLSDNGNLYEYMKHQLPLSPPYHEGRFTNGLVWVELVTKALYPADWRAHLLDYAFGGAGVLGENGDFDDDTLFTLNREIDSYLLAHQNKADEQSLFVVWMGANNYLAIPEDMDEAVTEVNWGIKTSLQRLVDRGAKHILVLNLPNLGKTPAAADFEAVDELSYGSIANNVELAKNLTQLQSNNPSVQWLFFNAEDMFQTVLENPSEYGFSNTTQTCYEEMIGSPSDKSVLNMVASVRPHNRNVQNACDGYLFFDPVHPSALAHQILSNKVLELLQSSGVEFE